MNASSVLKWRFEVERSMIQPPYCVFIKQSTIWSALSWSAPALDYTRQDFWKKSKRQKKLSNKSKIKELFNTQYLDNNKKAKVLRWIHFSASKCQKNNFSPKNLHLLHYSPSNYLLHAIIHRKHHSYFRKKPLDDEEDIRNRINWSK